LQPRLRTDAQLVMKNKMKNKAIFGSAHFGNSERLARPIKKIE